ncbi:MAG: acyl carrier protein [Egibacteraceae bacterium]
MDLTQTIKQFVVEAFLPDVSVDQLGSDYDLLSNGVIDSLGLLEVIAWLEDRFQIAIDGFEISPDNFRSVDAICSFIEEAAEPVEAE